VIILAIIIGLLAGSVKVLQPTEVGFVFNENTRTIDLSKIWGPGGRNFIGLGKRYVVYPTKILVYHFGEDDDAKAPAVTLFTADGQSVVITCTVMLRLVTEELAQLFNLYGENKFEANFIRIALTAIRNAAPQFTANDYFLNRAKISSTYYQAIKDEFSKIHGDLQYFQLLRIDLPYQLESAISNKIVTNQTAKTTQAQQEATLIRKSTDVIISQGNFEITQRVTSANINYTNTILQAQAQAQQIVLSAEAEALLIARDILGLADNSSKVLINWLWQRYLRQLENTDLWIGWNAVSQIVTP